MPVTCPHCSARYVLPESLLGPGGARVRCPKCREPFAVGPGGISIVPLPAPAANGAKKSRPATEETPAAAGKPADAGEPVRGEKPAATEKPAQDEATAVMEAAAPDEPPAAAAKTAAEGMPEDARKPSAEEAAVSVKPDESASAASAATPEPPAGGSDGESGEEPAPVPEVIETPAMVARQVLDELASHSGAAIAASQADGHLFREFGAVIAGAFDAYRLRVGSDADPAPFRAALRERWGVELEPGNPPKRLL